MKKFLAKVRAALGRNATPPPKVNMGGPCATCQFWFLHDARGDTVLGHCRRQSPIVSQDGRTLWPRTKQEFGCGQWRKRAEGGLS